MNTDNLDGQETHKKRPTTSSVIIQFTMARPSKATAKVVGIVLHIIIVLNCQYPLPPINWVSLNIPEVDDLQFKRIRTQRTRPTTLAVALLGRAMVNCIMTEEVVGLFLWVSCPLELSVLHVYHLRNASIYWW